MDQLDGSVRREPGQPRTLAEPGRPRPRPEDEEVEVPLVGQIAAGVPVDAVEAAEETFSLRGGWSATGQLFMLRVRGDSMTGAAISDGDLVVVRQQHDGGERRNRGRPAGPGRDLEATVKTLQRPGGHAWLMPQEPGIPADPGGRRHHLGQVVAVVRPALARSDPGGAPRR